MESGGKYRSSQSLVGALEIIEVSNTSQHNISTIKIASAHIVRVSVCWDRNRCGCLNCADPESTHFLPKILTFMCFISQRSECISMPRSISFSGDVCFFSRPVEPFLLDVLRQLRKKVELSERPNCSLRMSCLCLEMLKCHAIHRSRFSKPCYQELRNALLSLPKIYYFGKEHFFLLTIPYF